ncbi:MAG TPA: hypothetical protein VEX38_08495 [Fimbriimonadaceae bacterium]|nr:hypothetical protein [Fimbriimonadaceae bacterium]
MRISETLKKAAGLLVEFEEEPNRPLSQQVMSSIDVPATPAVTPKTVEQIVRESTGPNLDEIRVPEGESIQDAAPNGKPEFQNIYRQAGVPSVPFTAEQVLELINTLPAELPIETKRQTVRITLAAMAKTMGVSTDAIVADASRKLAALASFTDTYGKQATMFVSTAEAEIQRLEAQIAEKKSAIGRALQMQTHVAEVCQAESDRLDDVLEFFSLDLPPSKLAQP